MYQQVAVRPDGDFWTVEPLGELEALRLPDEGAIPAPDDHIPLITYAAETVDLRLEVDLTYFLTCSDIWVGYMSLSDGGWAGGMPLRMLIGLRRVYWLPFLRKWLWLYFGRSVFVYVITRRFDSSAYRQVVY